MYTPLFTPDSLCTHAFVVGTGVAVATRFERHHRESNGDFHLADSAGLKICPHPGDTRDFSFRRSRHRVIFAEC